MAMHSLDHNFDHPGGVDPGRRASALAPTLERGSERRPSGRTYDQRPMHDPPHPGEFIREVYLEPFALTGRQLAAKLDVSASTAER